jgi:hypothetical protein
VSVRNRYEVLSEADGADETMPTEHVDSSEEEYANERCAREKKHNAIMRQETMIQDDEELAQYDAMQALHDELQHPANARAMIKAYDALPRDALPTVLKHCTKKQTNHIISRLICTACAASQRANPKSKRSKINVNERRRRAEEATTLTVEADLNGPHHVGKDDDGDMKEEKMLMDKNNTWTLVVVDKLTHVTYSVSFDRKGEAKNFLKRAIAWMQAKTGRRLVEVILDNGTEFKGDLADTTMQNWFRDALINVRYTLAHEKVKNPLVERTIYMLNADARVILHRARAPLWMHAWAVDYVAHMKMHEAVIGAGGVAPIHYCPNATRQERDRELIMFGEKVFAYITDDSDRRSDYSSTSVVGFYLGIDRVTGEHMLLVPKAGEKTRPYLMKSRNVRRSRRMYFTYYPHEMAAEPRMGQHAVVSKSEEMQRRSEVEANGQWRTVPRQTGRHRSAARTLLPAPVDRINMRNGYDVLSDTADEDDVLPLTQENGVNSGSMLSIPTTTGNHTPPSYRHHDAYAYSSQPALMGQLYTPPAMRQRASSQTPTHTLPPTPMQPHRRSNRIRKQRIRFEGGNAEDERQRKNAEDERQRKQGERERKRIAKLQAQYGSKPETNLPTANRAYEQLVDTRNDPDVDADYTSFGNTDGQQGTFAFVDNDGDGHWVVESKRRHPNYPGKWLVVWEGCGGEYTVDESDMDPMPDGADDDEESKYDNEPVQTDDAPPVSQNEVQEDGVQENGVQENGVQENGVQDELVDTTNITDVNSIRLVANIIKRLQREEELIRLMSLDNKKSKQQRDQATDNVQNIINARHATPAPTPLSAQDEEKTDQPYTMYLWPSENKNKSGNFTVSMMITQQDKDESHTPIIVYEKMGTRVDISAITADLVEAQVSAVVKDDNGRDQIILEPNSEREMLRHVMRGPCMDACRKEYDALTENGTWEFVKASELPEGVRPIKCKWVWKFKVNNLGKIEKVKARLVARGDMQEEGVNYHETFACTVKTKTIKICAMLAVQYGLNTKQIDYMNAFLNGKVNEHIYMEQVPMFVRLPEKGERRPELLKLVKALYGIKQAPRVWNLLIDAFMKRMEFTSLISDPGTYVRLSRSGRPIIVTLYVDDKMILVAPEDEDEWKEIEKEIVTTFKITSEEKCEWILRMSVQHNNGKRTMVMSQQRYIEEMGARYQQLIEQHGSKRTVTNPCSTFSLTLDGKRAPEDEFVRHRHKHNGTNDYMEISCRCVTNNNQAGVLRSSATRAAPTSGSASIAIFTEY